MKATVGILLALLLGLNVWQFLDRKILRKELSHAEQETVGKMEDVAMTFGEEIASLERGKRALSKTLAVFAKGEESGGVGKNPMKAFSKAMENPGMKEIVAAEQRATLDAVCSRLYEHLGIKGEELEHFQKLITDAQMTMMKTGMKMLAGDLSREERQELATAIADAEAALKPFLNDDEDFDYYNFYTGTTGERTAMNGLRSVLELAGSTLDSETEEALVQLMFDERQAIDFEEHYYDQKRFDPSKDRPVHGAV
ncbi:MAG: hypothetical protein GWQ08_12460 [Verrucomicrobiaceae bacterium]|nr:hypothetical protein [Verrucomicrobiaceae bacterium]